MIKTEMEKLLIATNAPVNEGTPEDRHIEAPVRICFWEYLWEPLTASGKEYNTKVTYQVSVISNVPRCKEIIDLKHKLEELNLHPIIQIEYNAEDRRWHHYFPLEVLENV